jgi:signal transduction histidine kinase
VEIRPRIAFLAEVALVACGTGWIAALYGSLYIYATADFGATHSFWIFGWPFLLALLFATLSNLILAGAGGRIVPSPFGWVGTVNRTIGGDSPPEDADPRDLQVALAALPLFPTVNCLWAMGLASLVTAFMAWLEWLVAGTTRNVGPVLFAGTIATLTYGATSFTVGDLLVARRCARLRLAGVRRGLDPYVGPAFHTWVRVVTLAAPTVLALMIASRLAVDARGSWVALFTIIVAGSMLLAALAWLQALTIRNAAEDLGAAASRVARGEGARFITGSTDAYLVEMARAFNRAATEVDRSLRASAARYSALFEGAGDAILLLDAASGFVLEANRRAHELTGLDEEAIRRARIDELVAPLDGGIAGARFVLRSDGTRCPVDVALSTVAVGDATVLQAILHDVSERQRIENDLREADRLKSEFMGMMSHELRTPLNVFVGYTEMVLDAARENQMGSVSEHREVLERMLDAAGILTNLVEDTLSVLRLEGAGVRVNLEALSLQSLFAELQAAGRFQRGPSEVVERWIVEPDLPAIVSDRMKLRQIVTNLVSNARKFTTSGWIQVSALRSGDDEVAIAVEDTGCGIADADLPFVFDLYRQAGNGGSHHNGCGIGLYIVSRYCRVLGGRVDLRSEVGKGTRITITLPRLDGDASSSAQLLLPAQSELS